MQRRRTRRVCQGLATCVLVWMWCAGSLDAAAQVLLSDPAAVAETVATLSPFEPVGLTFAPDGRMFIWERTGAVRVFKNGALLPTPFIDIRTQVNSFGDRGLLGLALDPDFVTNGFVYLLHTLETGGDPNDAGPKTSRLLRVTADPANPDVALAGSEVVILDGLPSEGSSHSIGTVRVAPDGTLFVGSGDGASFSFVDPDALRAQDLDSYAGKILRINRDGSAPGDNPFDDGIDSVRSKVWAYGLRNPFRFTLHPVTGEPYIGDVGWESWEEINRGRGANFGWPCYEGNGTQPQYQAAFVQCRQLSAASVTPPLYTYGRGVGSTVIGGVFYTASYFPLQYQGNLFIADYTAGWIQRLVLDGNENLVSVEPFAHNVDGPVALEVGPDGFLYYVAFNSGEIGRIRFGGAPVARAAASPTSGYSPLTVSFTSAGSLDPGGEPLLHFWDFGDGSTSTSANPSHTYVSNGVAVFTARLTVTNTGGESASASVTVTVGSLPPAATILQPADGVTVNPGDVIVYDGSAADPDEGPLPPTSLGWTVLLHHNNTHVHPVVSHSGSGGSIEIVDHGVGNYAYEIILTATDSSGLTDRRSVLLPVNPTNALVTRLPFGYGSRDELFLEGWDFLARSSDGTVRDTERTGAVAVSYDQSLHPGVIRLPVGPGDIWQGVNDAGNMLFRDLPSDWESIQVKIARFDPTASYQAVGLLAYQDDDNYVTVWRDFSNRSEVEFYHEQGAVATVVSQTPLTNTGNLILRLDRNPATNVFSGFYSTDDGATWVALAGTITQVLANPRLAILVGANNAGTLPTADLAWVEVRRASAPLAPVVTGVAPSTGVLGQVLTVTVTGGNFQGGAGCSFGAGITVGSCVVSAANQLTAGLTIAAGAALGPRTVTVTNPDGQSGSLATGFTVTQAGGGTAGLVAAYGFEEGLGTAVGDASGNGLVGVVSGATWTTAGRFGGALQFDGINNVVSVGDAAGLDLGATGTISAWVRLSAGNRWHGILAKGAVNSLAAHNYGLEVANDNQVECGIGNGAAFDLARSSTPLASGVWVHLACVWTGSRLEVYVDGGLAGFVAQTVTPGGNTAPLWIGQYGGNSDQAAGVIDEVRIYNRALTASEIQADMARSVNVP